MISPFSSKAFAKATEPMFDEVVAVEGERLGAIRRQSLKVTIFADSSDEPISENAMNSENSSIVCVARENDWRFVKNMMVCGDKIRRVDGSIYQITTIARDSAMGWLFKARKVDGE